MKRWFCGNCRGRGSDFGVCAQRSCAHTPKSGVSHGNSQRSEKAPSLPCKKRNVFYALRHLTFSLGKNTISEEFVFLLSIVFHHHRCDKFLALNHVKSVT